MCCRPGLYLALLGFIFLHICRSVPGRSGNFHTASPDSHPPDVYYMFRSHSANNPSPVAFRITRFSHRLLFPCSFGKFIWPVIYLSFLCPIGLALNFQHWPPRSSAVFMCHWTALTPGSGRKFTSNSQPLYSWAPTKRNEGISPDKDVLVNNADLPVTTKRTETTPVSLMAEGQAAAG